MITLTNEEIAKRIGDIYTASLDKDKKPTPKTNRILKLAEQAKKGKPIKSLPRSDLVKLLKAVQSVWLETESS